MSTPAFADGNPCFQAFRTFLQSHTLFGPRTASEGAAHLWSEIQADPDLVAVVQSLKISSATALPKDKGATTATALRDAARELNLDKPAFLRAYLQGVSGSVEESVRYLSAEASALREVAQIWGLSQDEMMLRALRFVRIQDEAFSYEAHLEFLRKRGLELLELSAVMNRPPEKVLRQFLKIESNPEAFFQRTELLEAQIRLGIDPRKSLLQSRAAKFQKAVAQIRADGLLPDFSHEGPEVQYFVRLMQEGKPQEALGYLKDLENKNQASGFWASIRRSMKDRQIKNPAVWRDIISTTLLDASLTTFFNVAYSLPKFAIYADIYLAFLYEIRLSLVKSDDMTLLLARQRASGEAQKALLNFQMNKLEFPEIPLARRAPVRDFIKGVAGEFPTITRDTFLGALPAYASYWAVFAYPGNFGVYLSQVVIDSTYLALVASLFSSPTHSLIIKHMQPWVMHRLENLPRLAAGIGIGLWAGDMVLGTATWGPGMRHFRCGMYRKLKEMFGFEIREENGKAFHKTTWELCHEKYPGLVSEPSNASLATPSVPLPAPAPVALPIAPSPAVVIPAAAPVAVVEPDPAPAEPAAPIPTATPKKKPAPNKKKPAPVKKKSKN